MSYIDRNLLSDETILFRTKKHLIIFLPALLWTIFAIYAGGYMQTQPFLNQLSWVPFGLTLFLWAYYGLEYLFSEYAVTNKRVMMREGFFFRHTNEMRLSTISQVNVNQSLLGQLLNYGIVTLMAFGAQYSYTIISRPNEFQRYINQQADKNNDPK